MSEPAATRLAIRAAVNFPGFALEVDTDIDMDGVTGLFGPSGSGKSTLLRVVAGLERDASGRVSFGTQTWQDSQARRFVPACRRPVGFVFQDARLFTHLDVAGNLRFAVRRRTGDAAAMPEDEVVRAFDLDGLKHRDVASLSGGERQRVALARALLTGPRLLLLDEPMSGLDQARKREILPYLERLYVRFGIPAIYVSHSAAELAHVADRVVLLDGGRITAAGDAATILGGERVDAATTPFEALTVLNVRVAEVLDDRHLMRVDHRGRMLTVPSMADARPGDELRLAVQAGDVVLATEEPVGLSVRNVLDGRVLSIAPLPGTAFARVAVDVAGVPLQALLTQHAIDALGLEPGAGVYALIKSASFTRGV